MAEKVLKFKGWLLPDDVLMISKEAPLLGVFKEVEEKRRFNYKIRDLKKSGVCVLISLKKETKQ